MNCVGVINYGLVLVGQHHCDGWLRVVYIKRATGGDELNQPGGAFVVADIQGDGDSINAWVGAEDSETGHPYDVPEPTGFVLAGHPRRHDDVGIEHGAGQEQRKFYSSLLRGRGHVHLIAIRDGLFTGVGEDDFAECWVFSRFHFCCGFFGGYADARPRPRVHPQKGNVSGCREVELSFKSVSREISNRDLISFSSQGCMDLLTYIQIAGFLLAGAGGTLATFSDTRRQDEQHTTHLTKKGWGAILLTAAGIALGVAGQVMANKQSEEETTKVLTHLTVQAEQGNKILNNLGQQGVLIQQSLDDIERIITPINKKIFINAIFELPETNPSVAQLQNHLDNFIDVSTNNRHDDSFGVVDVDYFLHKTNIPPSKLAIIQPVRLLDSLPLNSIYWFRSVHAKIFQSVTGHFKTSHEGSNQNQPL